VRRAGLGATIGAAVLLAGLTGCGGGSPGPGAEGHKARPEAQVVRTASPERRHFTRTEPWFGRVESRRSVQVKALEAGRIEAVQAADGATVERCQPLFKLGGPAASARRAALESTVSSLEDQLRLAGREVDLKEDAAAEKLIRRSELLQAQGEKARLTAELASARQDLDRLGHALELTAPAAGTFARRRVSVGQDVAAGDTLAEIVATGSLRIVATLYPASADEAVALTEKTATVEQDEPSGTVARVLPDRTADGGTQVWIEGPGLDRRLHPGETVSGRVRLAVHARALAVPASAVVRDDAGRAFVFVAVEKGYEKRAVTTGLTAGGWVEILSGLDGLDPEARVVVRGAYELLYRDFAKTFRVAD
jgi:RND family efflux transporter MFP subunit